jgi:hypothetical protein
MAAGSASRGRHHRHRRPDPAGSVQRQPVVGRFRRLDECGRAGELPVSGRLLPVHAFPRRAELPRPPRSGEVPKGSAQEFGVSSTQYQVAQTACRDLFPATGGSIQLCETTGDCPQAVVQQALNVMRKYARCMRAHGVPNFPDPTTDSQGRPFFDVSNAGITHQYTHSSLFESKDRVCERLVGGSAGVPVPLG